MNIGIDIVKIDRFEKLKNNETFMNKIFCKSELDYIKEKNFNVSTIAGIFSAKEAFLKTIKKGLDVPLKDIEVCHDENGAPFIKLHNNLNKLNISNISVSISHDGDYAIAITSLKLS